MQGVVDAVQHACSNVNSSKSFCIISFHTTKKCKEKERTLLLLFFIHKMFNQWIIIVVDVHVRDFLNYTKAESEHMK